MVYHVIIALNSVGKMRVGNIISLLEKKGLELIEIQKKITPSKAKEFTDLGQLILQYKLNEMEAMVFYRGKFASDVLKKEIKYFYENHIELFFENDEESVDPNELWEFIVEKVFHGGKDVPLMFVTTSSGENGFNGSFIPNMFESDGPCYLPARTLIPLG